MPETFMKEVLCPHCEDGDKKPMKFVQQRGPYEVWYDDTKKKTIRAVDVGSRIIREFWICPTCHTVRWFDILIDKKRSDLPPEVRGDGHGRGFVQG